MRSVGAESLAKAIAYLSTATKSSSLATLDPTCPNHNIPCLLLQSCSTNHSRTIPGRAQTHVLVSSCEAATSDRAAAEGVIRAERPREGSSSGGVRCGRRMEVDGRLSRDVCFYAGASLRADVKSGVRAAKRSVTVQERSGRVVDIRLSQELYALTETSETSRRCGSSFAIVRARGLRRRRDRRCWTKFEAAGCMSHAARSGP